MQIDDKVSYDNTVKDLIVSANKRAIWQSSEIEMSLKESLLKWQEGEKEKSEQFRKARLEK